MVWHLYTKGLVIIDLNCLIAMTINIARLDDREIYRSEFGIVQFR